MYPINPDILSNNLILLSLEDIILNFYKVLTWILFTVGDLYFMEVIIYLKKKKRYNIKLSYMEFTSKNISIDLKYEYGNYEIFNHCLI
jgi:hypothetical protein